MGTVHAADGRYRSGREDPHLGRYVANPTARAVLAVPARRRFAVPVILKGRDRLRRPATGERPATHPRRHPENGPRRGDADMSGPARAATRSARGPLASSSRPAGSRVAGEPQGGGVRPPRWTGARTSSRSSATHAPAPPARSGRAAASTPTSAGEVDAPFSWAGLGRTGPLGLHHALRGVSMMPLPAPGRCARPPDRRSGHGRAGRSADRLTCPAVRCRRPSIRPRRSIRRGTNGSRRTRRSRCR